MQFQRIVEAVYFQPWSITWPGWRSIHSILKPRLNAESKVPESKVQSGRPTLDPLGLGTLDISSEDTDIFGQPMPRMEITPAGVAIIPISGPLIHHASLIEKMCGACSYDDIKDNVATAINTPGLQKIVFHVASPGGMCMGCAETAAVIDDAARFVLCEAVTDSQMCSAAFDIVAGCQRRFCTPSAIVGSIGALMPWLDESVRYEMAGYRMEVFASGPLKGAGVEGTSLTEEQREFFQGIVDTYASLFKNHVRARLPLVSEETMTGEFFIGSKALNAGLVDNIVPNVADAI